MMKAKGSRVVITVVDEKTMSMTGIRCGDQATIISDPEEDRRLVESVDEESIGCSEDDLLYTLRFDKDIQYNTNEWELFGDQFKLL